MNSIIYRKAEGRDIDSLISLRVAMQTEVAHAGAIIPAELPDALRDYFSENLANGAFIAIVAELDRRIIGASGMVFHQHPPSAGNPAGREAYVMNMYTLPEHRGQGIATSLLQKLIDVAREVGCPRVVLHGLPNGRGIYLRAGFVPGDSEMRLDLRTTRAPLSDEELLRQFESCTLPFDLWTHRAHVKVAYLNLRRHPFNEALHRMRDGIKRYNAHNRVPESETSGYNETTTHAFLHLIAATMQAYGQTFATPDADSFCEAHPQLLTRHVLRLFYSPERRMDPLAKVRFVETDLAPLPRIESV